MPIHQQAVLHRLLRDLFLEEKLKILAQSSSCFSFYPFSLALKLLPSVRRPCLRILFCLLSVQGLSRKMFGSYRLELGSISTYLIDLDCYLSMLRCVRHKVFNGTAARSPKSGQMLPEKLLEQKALLLRFFFFKCCP